MKKLLVFRDKIRKAIADIKESYAYIYAYNFLVSVNMYFFGRI